MQYLFDYLIKKRNILVMFPSIQIAWSMTLPVEKNQNKQCSRLDLDYLATWNVWLQNWLLLYDSKE